MERKERKKDTHEILKGFGHERCSSEKDGLAAGECSFLMA